jgi:catechol 2,3-dioxygenase
MATVQAFPEKIRLRPRRLAHGNIFVGDLEKSMRFYRDVCGIQEVFREPGIMAGFLSNGNSHHDIGLMQAANKPRVGRDGHVQIPTGRGHSAGLNHLGFEMESERELVAAHERAKAHGFSFHRTTDHGISHSLYVFDPEGTLLEFYADAIVDWRGFFADKENELISGPWTPDAAKASPRPLYTTRFEPAIVKGAPLRPRRLSRATLIVQDLAKEIAFYGDVAGLDCVAGGARDGYAVFAGAVGEHTLALFAGGNGAPAGLHHLGFELASDKDLADGAEALRRAGIPLLLEIDAPNKRSLVIADPDGLALEFYVPRAAPLPAPAASDAQRLYLI